MAVLLPGILHHIRIGIHLRLRDGQGDAQVVGLDGPGIGGVQRDEVPAAVADDGLSVAQEGEEHLALAHQFAAVFVQQARQGEAVGGDLHGGIGGALGDERVQVGASPFGLCAAQVQAGFGGIEVDFGEADDADVVVLRRARLAGELGQEHVAVAGFGGQAGISPCSPWRGGRHS